MVRKRTYENVKASFLEVNLELLDDYLPPWRVLMHYKCLVEGCGYEGTISANSFRRGQGCRECYIKRMRMPFKKVQEEYKEKGFNLLSEEKEYVNNASLMRYECNKGHKGKMCYGHMKRRKKVGCSKCKFAVKVNDFFKKQGCILLDEYTGSAKRIRFKCKCGEEDSTRRKAFVISKKCRKCSYKLLGENRTGNKNHSWIEDREEYERRLILKYSIRASIKKVLSAKNLPKYIGGFSKGKFKKMLGYTEKELIDRIYNHPNMESLKDKKWHLDHIFPIKAFFKREIYDIKLINALDNLQPLSAEDNLTKQGKYSKKAFEAWLLQKQSRNND